MTEQEYKSKQNELKQVRQNISDLGKRENELSREIARHDASVFMDKYYYDAVSKQWLKPVSINGEEILFMAICTYRDEDSYFTEYFIEHEYYWLSDIKILHEVPKSRFVENVNKILKEAKKTIFGDE